MNNRPLSIVIQVAAELRQAIKDGRWTDWLPAERDLAKRMRVSRSTLRESLGMLKEEGWILSIHGQGNRILLPEGGRRDKGERVVAVLTPDPPWQSSPYVNVWLDALREALIADGCRLHLEGNRSYFVEEPGLQLHQLVGDTGAVCWILFKATRGMQEWFLNEDVPCVVAGTPFEGVTLPFVDVDHRAVCRHAVGVFARHGHRRIALLIDDDQRSCDQECKAGFREAISSDQQGEFSLTVLEHGPNTDELINVLRQALKETDPPTAILVDKPTDYLSVLTYLGRQELRVPEDISLISQIDDSFLRSVIPEPARYLGDSVHYARRLGRPVLKIMRGEFVSPRGVGFFPDFIKGGSVGPVPE